MNNFITKSNKNKMYECDTIFNDNNYKIIKFKYNLCNLNLKKLSFIFHANKHRLPNLYHRVIIIKTF